MHVHQYNHQCHRCQHDQCRPRSTSSAMHLEPTPPRRWPLTLGGRLDVSPPVPPLPAPIQGQVRQPTTFKEIHSKLQNMIYKKVEFEHVHLLWTLEKDNKIIWPQIQKWKQFQGFHKEYVAAGRMDDETALAMWNNLQEIENRTSMQKEILIT